MRDMSRTPKGVYFLIASLIVLSSCHSGSGDGADFPSVTASSSVSVASATPSATSSRHIEISPACHLLSDKDIESVLGEKVQPEGHKSLFYSFAKIPMYVDICSWQAPARTFRAVQLEVDTAKSDQDAIAEYTAAAKSIREHTAPTAVPQSVRGLGTRAALLPAWLIAQRGREVITVTYGTGDATRKLDPNVLEGLAKAAAARLHWR
jgi:hypothetical protein